MRIMTSLPATKAAIRSPAAACACLLRDGEGRREYGRAGMRAGAGPGQAVEFESVRQRAVGERRRRRLHRAALPENAARAAGAGALGIGDDDAAPRQPLPWIAAAAVSMIASLAQATTSAGRSS